MFNDQAHKDTFLSLCPGKLLNDPEWSSTVFALTSDAELCRKTMRHINPKKRSIDWDKIMENDFAAGHRAMIYWTFALWAGNSWRLDGQGEYTAPVDTMDWAYSMDEDLRRTAITALELRWKIKGFARKESV